MIRSLFGGGKREEALPRELGPIQCAIGGALEIDTLGLQAALASGEPAMDAPAGGSFIVTAVGTASLDATSELTRYYDDYNRLVQVIAAPGGGPDTIFDVSLYAAWDSVVPVGRAEWDRWVGPGGLVGGSEYDANGILFRRYWASGEAHMPLVEFVETVEDEADQRRIHQRCMLYARPVGRGEEMLLINVEKELAESARQQGAAIAFMIGYGLGAADIRRV
jgi:hypothetical protein